MVRVRFRGALGRSLGLGEFEVPDGDLNDVLKAISERTGSNFEIRDGKMYILLRTSSGNVKSTISILYNGENILREKIERFEGGVLDVVTPLGGG